MKAVVLAVTLLSLAAPVLSDASCRRHCKAAIQRCVDVGYRRPACRRQLMRACQGLGQVACDVAFVTTTTTLPPTTTSTSTTTVPASLSTTTTTTIPLDLPLVCMNRCPDGSPAGWYGSAEQLFQGTDVNGNLILRSGTVYISLAVCASSGLFSGTLACGDGTTSCGWQSEPVAGTFDGTSFSTIGPGICSLSGVVGGALIVGSYDCAALIITGRVDVRGDATGSITLQACP